MKIMSYALCLEFEISAIVIYLELVFCNLEFFY